MSAIDGKLFPDFDLGLSVPAIGWDRASSGGPVFSTASAIADWTRGAFALAGDIAVAQQKGKDGGGGGGQKAGSVGALAWVKDNAVLLALGVGVIGLVLAVAGDK